MIHGKSMLIPLAGYFIDDEGDALTMTATYSQNGGKGQSIPGGLFTKTSPLTIKATSTKISDVGIYTISVIISDSKLSVPSSFTLEITNKSP